ncbi:MAG: methionyl-tRNA formyltransferase [Rickettsiales bacterium]|nr:methionyl-tRNA formyltransferase [Rickettsiales bacterium]
MKIIFMGSPDFAIPALEKIYNSNNHQIIAVYTQPPKPAARGLEVHKSKIHKKAEEFQIPVFTPKTLKDENEQKIFASQNADCAVVAAYGLLLPKPILDAPKWGCINIHPSKLPRWRGAAPIQRAIMAGDSETSVCIMKMAEGLDSGDILQEKIIEVPSIANAGYMHNLLADKGADLLIEVLDNIELYNKNARIQSDEGLVYAKKILANEEILDFSKPCIEIYNQIRGLSPYPAAYFIHNSVKYKVFESDFQLFESNEQKEKSADFFIQNNILKIKCADGFIIPKIIQKEGKKKMPIQDFLKGNKIF